MNVLSRLLLIAVIAACCTGCTSLSEYIHNGFKVGHNYKTPPAPVAEMWIDAADKRVRVNRDDLAGWWSVFDDPLLNQLINDSYLQNLTLREAGFRIMAARAQLDFQRGNFYPQTQTANGGYTRFGIGDSFFDQYNFGFNLAWELDFWGRFRRAIQSAQDNLDASIFEYDDAVVTLLADTASYYVQIRTTQERIRLLDELIQVQKDVLRFVELRLKEGKGSTELDRAQTRSNLKQSEASLNQLRIDLRIAQNQLCILLGRPVTDLTQLLETGPKQNIPIAPEFVVVGIPADLLRRRPDVRRAERLAAAQAEQVGIAEADWYPAISITGTLGWQAASLSNLFTSQALNSSVGPSFRWNILNYGRILANVRFQDAQLQQFIVAYQSAALQADLEAENGIVTFLQAQERAKNLRDSVDEAYIALEVIVAQYEAGVVGIDFNRYATIQQTLVSQQDLWAQSRGQIGQGLIQVYRALGGGWQIKNGYAPNKVGILTDLPPLPQQADPKPNNPELLPAPLPK